MKVRVIAAVLAALLAVLGAVLVAGYASAADERALQGLETKEVYVVDTTAPAETPVTDLKKHLRMQTLPLTAVAGDAVTDLGEFEGRVTAVQLEPGEQLLGSRLVDLGSLQSPGTAAVPKGLQAVTVQLTADRVVGGQLQAGDTVGVFASFDSPPAEEPQTTMYMHKVMVVSVQGAPAATETAEEDGASAAPVPEGAMLVTLALGAADAEKTVFTAEFGSLWLSKEPKDAEENDSGAKMEDFPS